MAIRQDFTSFVGEDIRLRTTMTTNEDITGWTFTFTSKAATSDVANFIEHLNAVFTIEDAGSASTPGIFYTDIPDTETDTTTGGATAGDYAFDIKRIDAGVESILVYGTWTLANTPSRDVA